MFSEKRFRTGSNSYGQFWYGKGSDFPGFLYKKNVGVGGRRSTRFNAGGNTICNTPQYIYNKYSPGQSGVGANSIANRRAKNRRATVCTTNTCFPCYMTLGQYSNYTHNPNGFIPCPTVYNSVPLPDPTPPIIKSVPSPPLNVNAVSNNPDEATISFSPPTNNGGSAIISYTVLVTSTPILGISNVTGTSSPITIPNLPPNIPYTFNVIATNAIGDSTPSASSPIVEPAPLGSIITQFTTTGSDSWTPPYPTVIYAIYLVVGGGGGGGGAYDNSAGGGGGGGLALVGSMRVTYGQTYNVVVGDGGAGAERPPYVSNPNTGQNDGTSGDQSSFDTIIAGGGGFGYRSRTKDPAVPLFGTGGSAASGTIAPTGGNGGTGGSQLGGGGGGGNTSNGSNTTTTTGAAGGTGLTTFITGAPTTYGAGGSGGTRTTNSPGVEGDSNTGNGGGGGGCGSGTNIGGSKGGSGIVILQYYY